MAIILDTAQAGKDAYYQFLEQKICSSLIRLLPETRFVCTQPVDNPLLSSFGSSVKFPSQKGWFYQKKTEKWLQQQAATAFISCRGLLKTGYSLRQFLVVADGDDIPVPESIPPHSALVFVSKYLQQVFQEKYPSAAITTYELQTLINDSIENKELSGDDIRETIAAGREYFLLADFNITQEKLIIFLKGFSIFKRMLHSSWKLMLVLRSGKEEENARMTEVLNNYKYRDDIIITNDELLCEKMRDAYALVTLDVAARVPIPAMEAIRQKTPVLAFSNEALSHLLKEGVVYFEHHSSEAVGELLMKMYKDENQRMRIKQKLEEYQFTDSADDNVNNWLQALLAS